MIRILQKDNRVTKVLFAVIIGVAVISMVAYLIPGINDAASAGTDPTVFATVHAPGFFGRFTSDETVPAAEVTRIAQMQLRRQNMPEFLLKYAEQQAGHMLVQNAILKQEADRLGLQVSDADLRRELETGQFAMYLFPNGDYIGDEKYMDFVQTNFNMTRSQFEAEFKKDMEVQRLQALVTGGVTVSDNAVRDSFRVSGTKIKFDYAVVNSDDLLKTINPTDAELQSFFKDSKARYATAIPEMRKISYFAFGVDNLPGGKPQVSDEEVQKYYTAHLADYEEKEQVKARHILIAVAEGDAKADAAAKAKAENLLKQIKGGADFAKLASENSDDPGSKANGGDLPFMGRGQTVPEFDKALFSMQPGQISDVIKTKFGYHIIQVQEKKPAKTRSMAEVKPEIVPILMQQKIGVEEQKYAQALAAEAGKAGLEKTAAAHGLHLQTTDYLAKDGIVAGVADGAALLTQAFAATKGAAPASVASGDGYAIYQVTDIHAAHAPTFEEYKSHIAEDYREQKVPQLLAAQLAKLSKRAKELGNLQKAAAEMGLTLKSSDLVGKDGQVPDFGAMSGPGSVAFDLPKGGISDGINTGRVGVVLTVTDKQEPSAEEIAKNFNQTKEQLLGERRDEVFRVFAGTLVDKYEKEKSVRYTKPQGAPGSSPFGT